MSQDKDQEDNPPEEEPSSDFNWSLDSEDKTSGTNTGPVSSPVSTPISSSRQDAPASKKASSSAVAQDMPTFEGDSPIAMIGFSASGKTVYQAMLYYCLTHKRGFAKGWRANWALDDGETRQYLSELCDKLRGRDDRGRPRRLPPEVDPGQTQVFREFPGGTVEQRFLQFGLNRQWGMKRRELNVLTLESAGEVFYQVVRQGPDRLPPEYRVRWKEILNICSQSKALILFVSALNDDLEDFQEMQFLIQWLMEEGVRPKAVSFVLTGVDVKGERSLIDDAVEAAERRYAAVFESLEDNNIRYKISPVSALGYGMTRKMTSGLPDTCRNSPNPSHLCQECQELVTSPDAEPDPINMDEPWEFIFERLYPSQIATFFLDYARLGMKVGIFALPVVILLVSYIFFAKPLMDGMADIGEIREMESSFVEATSPENDYSVLQPLADAYESLESNRIAELVLKQKRSEILAKANDEYDYYTYLKELRSVDGTPDASEFYQRVLSFDSSYPGNPLIEGMDYKKWEILDSWKRLESLDLEWPERIESVADLLRAQKELSAEDESRVVEYLAGMQDDASDKIDRYQSAAEIEALRAAPIEEDAKWTSRISLLLDREEFRVLESSVVRNAEKTLNDLDRIVHSVEMLIKLDQLPFSNQQEASSKAEQLGVFSSQFNTDFYGQLPAIARSLQLNTRALNFEEEDPGRVADPAEEREQFVVGHNRWLSLEERLRTGEATEIKDQESVIELLEELSAFEDLTRNMVGKVFGTDLAPLVPESQRRIANLKNRLARVREYMGIAEMPEGATEELRLKSLSLETFMSNVGSMKSVNWSALWSASTDDLDVKRKNIQTARQFESLDKPADVPPVAVNILREIIDRYVKFFESRTSNSKDAEARANLEQFLLRLNAPESEVFIEYAQKLASIAKTGDQQSWLSALMLKYADQVVREGGDSGDAVRTEVLAKKKELGLSSLHTFKGKLNELQLPLTWGEPITFRFSQEGSSEHSEIFELATLAGRLDESVSFTLSEVDIALPLRVELSPATGNLYSLEIAPNRFHDTTGAGNEKRVAFRERSGEMRGLRGEFSFKHSPEQ